MLTLSDLNRLSAIYEAVVRRSNITWTPDEGETILSGVMRSFTDENYNSASAGGMLDIRDAYVWVSGGISEHLLAVRDLMAWQDTGAVAFKRLG